MTPPLFSKVTHASLPQQLHDPYVKTTKILSGVGGIALISTRKLANSGAFNQRRFQIWIVKLPISSISQLDQVGIALFLTDNLFGPLWSMLENISLVFVMPLQFLGHHFLFFDTASPPQLGLLI